MRRRLLLAAAPVMAAAGASAQGIQRSIVESVTRGVAEAAQGAARSGAIRAVLVADRTSARITECRCSSGGAVLVVATSDGLAHSWSLRTGQLLAKVRVSEPEGFAAFEVSDRLEASALRRAGGAEVVDLTNGQVLRQVHTSAVDSGAVSSPGSIVVTVSRGVANLVDLSRGSIVPLAGTGPAIAASAQPGERLFAIAGADGAVRLVDAQGRVSATIPGGNAPIEAVAWQRGGQVLSTLDRDGVLRWVDTGGPGMAPPRMARLPQGRPTAIAWDSATQCTVTADSSGTLRLFDGAQGILLRSFTEEDNRVDFLTILPGGRIAVSASRRGDVKVWSVMDGLSRAQLILTQRGWAVIDALGRYDGSDSGLSDVRWQASRMNVPVERFVRHRESGLLARIAAGIAIEGTTPALGNGIYPPPLVRFVRGPSMSAGSRARLTVRAEDRGGGLSSVVLFRNGRVIASTPASGRGVEVDFELSLLQGVNTFRAVATDRLGLESEPASAQLNTPEPGGGGVLHVLSVAVDRYQDRGIRPLALSVRDALAVEAALADRRHTTFADVQIQQLHNAAATRDAVAGALASFRDVSSRDAIVLFLAGHGVAQNNDWTLLPYDAVLRGSAVDRGIGADLLQTAIANSPARQILVLIDSCESGQAASQLSEFLERGRFAALAREGGVGLLAATRPDQPSYESVQLGHGLLTAALLQGLQGAADVGRHDGRIRAQSLVAYAEAAVPVLSRRYVANLQVPVAIARGADFVIRTY